MKCVLFVVFLHGAQWHHKKKQRRKNHKLQPRVITLDTKILYFIRCINKIIIILVFLSLSHASLNYEPEVVCLSQCTAVKFHSSEIPFWLKTPQSEMSSFCFIPVSRRKKKFLIFCPLMWDITSLYLTGSAMSLSDHKIWALPFWRINLKIHCFALCTCSPLESLYDTVIGHCFIHLKTGLRVTHAYEYTS